MISGNSFVQRGGFWVAAQFLLLAIFVILPAWRPGVLSSPSAGLFWTMRTLAILSAAGGLFLGLRGALDLGSNLTPLPHPTDRNELVKLGAYALVRHPLYSAILHAALAWSLWNGSLSHLLMTVLLFFFFDKKAAREEKWLEERHSEYGRYKEQVRRFFPGVY